MTDRKIEYNSNFYEEKIKDSILPGEFVESISPKGTLYMVGGAVRDLINTGELSEEVDFLLVGWHVNEVLWKLNTYGSAAYVGHSFGVIKFTYNGITSDISVPEIRGSESTLKSDLENRDFTINSVAMRLPDMEIFDPFGGVKDIFAKVIREDTALSLFQDPIRSLRGIRFSVQFGFQIEEKTMSHIKQSTSMLDSVSPERIRDEVCKILVKIDKPSEALRMMQQMGIIRHIMPEVEKCIGVGQEGGWHIYDVFEHTLKAIDNAPKDLVLRLSLLFHDIGKPLCRYLDEETGRAHFTGHDNKSAELAKKRLKKLRFSNDIIEDVLTIIGNHMTQIPETEKGKKRLIRRLGEERIPLFIQHRIADLRAMDVERVKKEIEANRVLGLQLREIIDRKPPLQVKDLAIGGDELIEKFDIEQGPKIGEILDYLMDRVLEDIELNNRKKLLELSRDYIKNNL
ncbi:MAG: HD domain-containing protein [Candidatus Zixiibacteriota bacterium]